MIMYIRYYKEKDTDPMVFLQRFRCTTEPIGGSTEYDEEGELVSWDAAVAAIEIAMKHLGWHPASELPVIPEGKFSVSVIAYCNTPSGIYAPVEIAYTRTGGWQYESVKWWCYPPKEE